MEHTLSLAELLQEAVGLHQKGDYAKAQAIYQNILKEHPTQFDALHLLGVSYLQNGQTALARPLIEAALQQEKHPHALSNYGMMLLKEGELPRALDCFNQAIAQAPDYWDAIINRAGVLHRMKRFDEALADYDRALVYQPNHINLHKDKSQVLKEMKRFDEAIASCQHALSLNPKDPGAWNVLGVIQESMGKHQAALDSYEKSLVFNPQLIEGYGNKGHVLQALHRLTEAALAYEAGLKIYPENPDLHLGYGFCLLNMRQWHKAWQEYAWRWKIPRALEAMGQRYFSQPCWYGEYSLQGKTIILHSEQGLGDTLQFVRYIPLVKAQGAKHIILLVDKVLQSLLQYSIAEIDQVVSQDPIPTHDCHCPLMDLPLALMGVTAEPLSIVPYLKPPPHKIPVWEQYLKGQMRPLIGLVWAGGPLHPENMTRSINLELLVQYLPQNQGTYISLQKEYTETDLKRLPTTVIQNYAPYLEDFSDTAALVAQMDLIITIDTSVAHLAGAMGKPVWILIPFVADWRWSQEGETSVWYPTARLFRQILRDNWGSVLSDIAQSLSGNFTHPAPPLAKKPTLPIMAENLQNAVREGFGQFAEEHWDRVEQICEAWLAHSYDYPEILHLYGLLHYERTQWAEALRLVRRAISLMASLPIPADLYYHQALILAALQRPTEAENAIQTALVRQPENPVYHTTHGDILQQMGKPPEAATAYRQALTYQPQQAWLWHNLGKLLQDLGEEQSALNCYQQALQQNHSLTKSWVNAGLLLEKNGQWQNALHYYQQALQQEPLRVELLKHSADLLEAHEQWAVAISYYQRLLSLHPQEAFLWMKRGVLHEHLSQTKLAEECYREAVLIVPSDPSMRHQLALCLLTQGHYKEGWKAFESRWELPNRQASYPSYQFSQPRWQGENLQGKTIALLPEQGLGDMIQFYRYIHLVKQQGARIILPVPAPLYRLMPGLRGLTGDDFVFPYQEPLEAYLPPFDWQCPVMSLAGILDTEADATSARGDTIPYLSIPQHDQARWAEQLKAINTPRIGIVWAGNPNNILDTKRSLPLSLLLEYLPGTLICLHHQVSPQDEAILSQNKRVYFYGESLNLFETAALITQLDLVISIDTSIAHLTGALGKPLWLMLACSPDWRWMQERNDSPWYPSARLFRQSQAGNWHSVLETIRQELRSPLPL